MRRAEIGAIRLKTQEVYVSDRYQKGHDGKLRKNRIYRKTGRAKNLQKGVAAIRQHNEMIYGEANAKTKERFNAYMKEFAWKEGTLDEQQV
jgi:hypothetical protein